jgi:hypothetical protein
MSLIPAAVLVAPVHIDGQDEDRPPEGVLGAVQGRMRSATRPNCTLPSRYLEFEPATLTARRSSGSPW